MWEGWESNEIWSLVDKGSCIVEWEVVHNIDGEEELRLLEDRAHKIDIDSEVEDWDECFVADDRDSDVLEYEVGVFEWAVEVAVESVVEVAAGEEWELWVDFGE